MAAIYPTLEGFNQVIEQLAADPRIPADSRDWIQDNRAVGGDKVRILKHILKHASLNGQPARVLDVGAQIGALALFAAQAGCKAAAVDYGFYASQYGRIAADRGVDYRECDVALQPLPFSGDTFDFVTYTDVIEHHSFSPKRVLREIHRVLVPGGRIIVSTPNHASIYNRFLLLIGKSVNDNFDQYFDASAESNTYFGHHREYTRAELRMALKRAGFKVIECRVIEEDLGSLIRFLKFRGFTWSQIVRQRRALVVRALGRIWGTLHLPFGRVLWAVGEKM